MSIIAKCLLWPLLSTFVVAGAHAYELEEGTGVVCDTEAQIERFVFLGAKADDVKLINAEAHKNVCVMTEVRYIRGSAQKTHRLSYGTVQVVEILVVAFNNGGWVNIPPEIQYTIFLIPEEDA